MGVKVCWRAVYTVEVVNVCECVQKPITKEEEIEIDLSS